MFGCGDGALQTRGTCWFFSIINGFLLSEAGQKILFDHLEKFYKGLDATEKAYFDDGIDAPCPLRANIIKTKRIYFYKFLDQYLCFRSGPRSISLKAGKSANILGVASLAGSVAKTHAGGQGAFPNEELPKILKHLGLTDYLIANEYGYLQMVDAKKRPHFVICKGLGRNTMTVLPKFRPGTYSRMCCSVTIGNSNASNTQQHKYHAITGFVCNGKGYLFDSNQRKNFPCDWWNAKELANVINKDVARFYDFFAGGQINYMAYNYVIFSRDSYIDSIKPVCRLKYKSTTTPFVSSSINPNNVSPNFYNPAQIAALKRHRAKPALNKAFFNSLLLTAKNKNNAKQKINDLLSSGYRMKNYRELYEFERQLRNRNAGSPTKTKAANPNFSSPKKNQFEIAKNHMSLAKTKTQRGVYYSLFWKKVPMHERKVLMHFRNTGEWLARNYFKKSSPSVKPPIKRKSLPKPIPINSPTTVRRKKVESNFKNYWGGLTQNNRKTVRNLITTLKSPSPVKSQSPNPYVQFKNALVEINTLKTAQKRAEWLKAKKFSFKKDELSSLRNYVKGKNQANRNRRAAKKVKS
jgi:hypothetical protein